MKLFFNQNIIIENFNSPSINQIDEIDDIVKQLNTIINNEIKTPSNLINKEDVKQTLNPTLWIEDTLNPSIKKELLDKAESYFKNLNLPKNVKVKDIILCGSLTNYNWSKYSEIDIYVIIDFDNIAGDEKTLTNQFKPYNSSIEKIPLEINIHNAKDKIHTSSAYSLKNDKWILKPSNDNLKINKNVIRNKINNLITILKDIKQDYNNQNYTDVIRKTQEVIAKLKKYNNSGLENGGKYSIENLIYKVIRKTPYLEILNDLKAKANDAETSLEEDMNLK